jgi:hypothetical protein
MKTGASRLPGGLDGEKYTFSARIANSSNIRDVKKYPAR